MKLSLDFYDLFTVAGYDDPRMDGGPYRFTGVTLDESISGGIYINGVDEHNNDHVVNVTPAHVTVLPRQKTFGIPS